MNFMGAKPMYFLGAGASCEALPLVKEFPARLNKFRDELYSAEPNNKISSQDNNIWKEDRQKLIDSIQWLSENGANHASIDTLDTFAKKLFFKGDYPALRQLKAALSVYSVVEQSEHTVDKRYDSFLASVLELDDRRIVRLPDDIKILTWNYDTQLEKAFFGFCEDDNTVIERITLNPNDQLYRINGYCGTTQAGHIGKEFTAIWRLNAEHAIENGIRLYNQYMKGTANPDINFAWEEPTKTILNNTIQRMKLDKIESIVVIGYSFPYFNREIDKIIFTALINAKSIYLQYPEGEHDSIAERLKRFGLKDDSFRYIKETDLFYIPDEF